MELHQDIDSIHNFALLSVDQAGDNVVLPTESASTTGICMQQLNTHCLMEIFSSNSLTLMDLCSIAETCARFKQIVEKIFPKNLSVEGCLKSYEFKSKRYGKNPCSLRSVERILKKFGQYVSTVSMIMDDDLLRPLAEYCGTAILERVVIQFFRKDQGKNLSMKLKTVFQRMLALSFHHCKGLRTLVTCPKLICDSLIELKITYTPHCADIMRNTFPKLERFTFIGNTMFSEEDEYNFSEILPNFLLRHHKRLTTLNLESDSVYCSSQLMEIIINKCTELTNLTLDSWYSPRTSFNFSHLNNLHKLRMLAVQLRRIHYRQLIALLEVVKTVRTLKLDYSFGPSEHEPQIFSVISQMQNLCELHLEYGHFDQIPWSKLRKLRTVLLRKPVVEFPTSHLLHIIRELRNLEELSYYGYDNAFELSSEDFGEIVKIIKRRPNKLTLTCKLSKDLAKNYDRSKNVNLIEYKHSSDVDGRIIQSV